MFWEAVCGICIRKYSQQLRELNCLIAVGLKNGFLCVPVNVRCRWTSFSAYHFLALSPPSWPHTFVIVVRAAPLRIDLRRKRTSHTCKLLTVADGTLDRRFHAFLLRLRPIRVSLPADESILDLLHDPESR